MLPEGAYDQLNARPNGKRGLRRYDLYAMGHVCEHLGLKEPARKGEAGSGKSLSINEREKKGELMLKGLTGKTGWVRSV